MYSADSKVDPVGACVGLRGARVKNIVRELNNEKVDIIRWSDDMSEFVTDALKPAIIRSINIEEEDKRVRVTVDEEELSKAIGRRGQNARLTSRLLGWDVQIDKDESQHEAFEQRVVDAADEFVKHIGEENIDRDTAIKLVKGGIVNLDFFSMVDAGDIAEILDGDQDAAARIYNAAQSASPPAVEDSGESQAEQTGTEPGATNEGGDVATETEETPEGSDSAGELESA